MKQEKYLNVFTDGSTITTKRPFLKNELVTIYPKDNFTFACKKLSADPEKNSTLSIAYRKKIFNSHKQKIKSKI